MHTELTTRFLLAMRAQPIVMGVVNITDDSFYCRSRKQDEGSLLACIAQMVDEGVDIIDVGAASSRPGAVLPAEAEEIKAQVWALKLIRNAYPELAVSVDVNRAAVLKECLPFDIQLVNDISGGSFDPLFFRAVAQSKLPYVLMHMRGTPTDMQSQVHYDDLIWDISQYFIHKLRACRALGIRDFIVDPGFGFAKTLDDNYKLLAQLSSLRFLEVPIMAGVSRKSMIYKFLETTPEYALNGTTALHMLALAQGATILRVHDVKEARECVKLWQKYNAYT